MSCDLDSCGLAEPARWSVSAPGLAVRTVAGVFTGRKWPSRAAPARARGGVSAGVGAQGAAGLRFHLETEGQAGLGVLSESPGSRCRRGRVRRRLLFLFVRTCYRYRKAVRTYVSSYVRVQ